MKDYEYFQFIKGCKKWETVISKTHEVNYYIELKAEENEVILYFQESHGWKDWVDNLCFLPIFCKVYKQQENHMICHNGFVREYKSANDVIMAELIHCCEMFSNPPKVIITGWSNGAAMATLAAEDFYYRYGLKPEVVTFGNPKVCFDKRTAEHIYGCCSDFREYCNWNDIVTKVPPFGEHVHKINCGGWKLFGIFNPWKYHCYYDEDIKENHR